jgi:aminoglycoside phosphotransferase (APT) family kinase protein
MSHSAHARYRPRLAALACDSAVVASIAEGGSWERRYARFEPDSDPFATLVFESTDVPQRVIRVDVSESPRRDAVRSEPGWLRARPFDLDDQLTTLPTIVRQPGSWRVVRYLPGRRCTLRLETAGRPVRYVKVYRDGRGQRADAAGRWLWCAARRGELAFSVPRPDRWEASTRSLFQHELAGSPATRELYGPHGAEVARRIGHAAASLAQSSVRPTRVFDAAAQTAHSIDIGHELARRVPSLARLIETLISRLSDVHTRTGPRQLRPIHGDPHAEQWLNDGQHLGLLDFEAVAWGDPELDAAVFLAELDFEDDLQLPVDQLEQAYRTGAEASGLTLDRELLLAYRGHKRLAKALRSARAVRPDGDRRAEAHLMRALECVAR